MDDDEWPHLLTNLEATQFLRLDTDYEHDPVAAVRALHRLVRKGKIRPVKCGTTYKYARTELLRYIADETRSVAVVQDIEGG